MSLMELMQELDGLRTVLLVVAFGGPVFLGLLPLVWRNAARSRMYGRIASGAVAAGLVVGSFGLAVAIYLHRTGTNLVSDVDFLALLGPVFFGAGMLFAGTRVLSLEELRRYPVLRRVWSLLMAGLLLFVVFLVLRHTYWLVFSGIIGFLIVAVVVWTVFGSLLDRATGPEPDDDLLDEVAARSRQRLKRLSDAAAGSSRRDER